MQILGLQIDKPFVRAALIQKGRAGLKISILKSALISDPDKVKQLYIPKFKGRIISGLSSKELLIRPMVLKMTDSRHFEEALSFQSEGATYLDPSDTIAVPHSIKKTEGKIEALLFSASRKSLHTHLQDLSTLQIDPDCVTSNALALIRYVKWRAPMLEEAFLVDLGSSEWSCILMEKGELKKSHSLGLGFEALLAALWEDRKKVLLSKEVEGIAKQIDLSQLQAHLNQNLSKKLNEMRQELGKIILSFHRSSNPRPIVFTGYTDAFRHLREFLIETCKEAISPEIHTFFDVEEQKYAIAIGLALEQADHPLQLLRKEFFPKKNWQKAGFYACTLGFFSIFLSSILFIIGTNILEERKNQAIESVQALMEEWDPQLKQALLKNEKNAIDRWIRAIATHSKEYPYILQAPRVAEVLAWLSAHPLLAEFENENIPFEIQSIHYQLIECPKIGSPKIPYQAKLDLEFQLKSPMSARKFHEALLKGDKMVDAQREISWEALSDRYKISFFLKNRKSSYVL